MLGYFKNDSSAIKLLSHHCGDYQLTSIQLCRLNPSSEAFFFLISMIGIVCMSMSGEKYLVYKFHAFALLVSNVRYFAMIESERSVQKIIIYYVSPLLRRIMENHA